jgi:hypothetical protein
MYQENVLDREIMDIEPKHEIAAVTICATNYLGKALALRQSYLTFHPKSDFYLLIVDKKYNKPHNLAADVKILWAEDLDIDNFTHYAMKFDVIELCTAVKAPALSKLLKHYRKVLYLDPDIYLYSDLGPLVSDLESCSIAVTPHTLTPVMDGEAPSDLDFLRMGAFNLGFIGVSKCEESFSFLEWWSRRCLEYGFYEPQLGLAVDQKWVDLAPSFFPGLKILRDPGLNVAYWNLHERMISKRDKTWLVNEKFPLRFFHFSAFVAADPRVIAKGQTRFTQASRPDLHELLEGYAECLRSTGAERYSREIYSFDYFEAGIYVSPTLRRFYGALESSFPKEEDPFARDSKTQEFATSEGLASKHITAMPRRTFKEMEEHSRAIRIIAFGLRNILRMFGPNRYFLLMRYMAHISSIRNQGGLFPDIHDQWV